MTTIINYNEENKVSNMDITTINSTKITNILSKFDEQEARTCLEAVMLLNLRDFSEEKFYETLRNDFGVLGNIMSGSNDHYKLMRKINSLSISEKINFANFCLGMWKGSIEEMEEIAEAVNRHCIEKDVMKLTGFSEESHISTSPGH